MEHFEKTHIYPLIENKTKLYLRYIDDIIMIWTGSENELFNFLNDLNKKHRSIKFDYKYSTKKIEFLDTQLYITEECKLETTLYRKPTDCQNYLHASSNHPYSLKKSIPYSQALRIKRICTSTEEYKTHCTALRQQLVEKRYNANLIKEQIERVDCLDRELLIIENKPKKSKIIPLSVTYNKNLPNIKSILDKHWHILKSNNQHEQIFKENPIIAFRKNKSLKDIIGGNTIEENKRKLKVKKKTTGKCSPCFSNKGLCCNHILNTSTFQSSQTKETFNIYHHVNCKSKYVIYLLQCDLCNCQYIGKSETPFNIRLNNHRKDVSSINAIPACKHFNKPAHNFNTHAKFTIIEKLEKTVNVNKETLTKRLKQRENFWIKRLKTLTPNGLNQELN